LDCGDRTTECGVDVSRHDDEIGLEFTEDAFQLDQGVLGRSSVELHVRPSWQRRGVGS